MDSGVIKAFAMQFGVDAASIIAVMEVESSGKGFNPDGSLVSLFEGHVFYKYTNGKYAKTHSSICYKKWSKSYYGKTWEQEKSRLEEASLLDRTSALLSTSWGLFQIMGFNHSHCGYSTVDEFVGSLAESENNHMQSFLRYIKSKNLIHLIQKKDWASFAMKYNGPRYGENNYSQKLELAYRKALKCID